MNNDSPSAPAACGRGANVQCPMPNADDLLAADRSWLLEQWQQALLLGEHALLVIDEVQKVSNWPETIKALWDKQPIHQVARPAAGQREYRRMTARSKWEDFSSSLSVLN